MGGRKHKMSDISQQIEKIRTEWGRRLLILGHHYQRSSVVAHADETGDSLELARKAAANSEVERIVFCGVHFMAESADILSQPEQTVYMPEYGAGCPMADMGDADAMETAWNDLSERGNDWLPVVYVNSTAEVKAVCGRHGGSCCTSSNAARVFQWVFDQGKKVLFLPDEHLGANSAHDLGVPDDEVAIYDPRKNKGGLSDEQIDKARVVVWKGFCIVHQAFTVDQIKLVREKMPDAKIIVHPESPKEAVRLCDAHGSTAQIIDYVNAAQDGETIVIGTEFNLVQRLAEQHKDRLDIKALKASVCANMAKTTERNLLALLQGWDESSIIHVDGHVASEAKLSLERMLSI
jgi:quinolinate synthase